jgi:hypothetical protein
MATATKTIVLERFLERRDVDAALYLLGCMLSLGDKMHSGQRKDLTKLKVRLVRSGHISAGDKKFVISSYREIIG